FESVTKEHQYFKSPLSSFDRNWHKVTGLLLLIVGIAVLSSYSSYEEMITNRFFNVPAFTVATGVFILLAAVLGFYGAISQSFYVIAAYVILLLVVLVFEIAIVIAAFSLKNDAPTVIRATMLESLQLYSTRLDIAKLWDDLQMAPDPCELLLHGLRNHLPLRVWNPKRARLGLRRRIRRITGIIILSVGISVQSAYNNYHEFLSERFFSLPAFCIATGIIIFLIACFGFYGALRENYMMTMAFAGAMVVMFIFQLSACIAGYALRGNTIALVQKQLSETMDLYGPDKNYEVTKLWDEFLCCGVTNASDWLPHLNTQDSDGLPVTCCPSIVGAVSVFNCTVTTAYSPGCADAFGSWTRSHAGTIGVAGVFLVLMQVCATALVEILSGELF
ncbi:Tetraspanin, partial [Operophtera brumata]